MLNKNLLDFQYYYNKLPLYLRNSYGFEEHFKIWFDLLLTIDNNEDIIINFFNIFDENYEDNVEKLKCAGSDILDKIGKIFNIKRNFSFNYVEGSEEKQATVSLNNKDFLLFIRATIIKNYCNGSFQEINDFYIKSGLPIVYNASSSGPATIDVYFIEREGGDTFSDNVKLLFKGGFLNIRSMGIVYSNYVVVNIDKLARWDISKWSGIDDSGNYFSGGQWGV